MAEIINQLIENDPNFIIKLIHIKFSISIHPKHVKISRI